MYNSEFLLQAALIKEAAAYQLLAERDYLLKMAAAGQWLKELWTKAAPYLKKYGPYAGIGAGAGAAGLIAGRYIFPKRRSNITVVK
jgi:hypothetical protein